MTNREYVSETLSNLKKAVKEADNALYDLEQHYVSDISDYLEERRDELEGTSEVTDKVEKTLNDLKSSFDTSFDHKVDEKRAQYKQSMDANRIYKK